MPPISVSRPIAADNWSARGRTDDSQAGARAATRCTTLVSSATASRSSARLSMSTSSSRMTFSISLRRSLLAPSYMVTYSSATAMALETWARCRSIAST
ncbi:Uncharacterised protein [Mycobacteroides abscessus subsp. abscessus]|nr:Uncharacterised protein [Mycobacteroides abscessus subsp. abscessus]